MIFLALLMAVITGRSYLTTMVLIDYFTIVCLRLKYFYFFISEPYKGIKLWLQHFRAMFVKRFYYSVRFYPSLIVQVVFPILFTVFGLIVIISNSKGVDPPRVLSMRSSGLDSGNTTIFYAELEGHYMDFSVRFNFFCFNSFSA